ncbi:MAG TPA: metal-dependent hydrolase [Patescibacteria group bacterium]|nr:metal-dependent hydrolase [Patescibacteria group bacterium]
MNQLTYYGHSCFLLHNASDSLLFDPFFTGNPWNKARAEEIRSRYVLVSHGHGDHLGDAITIAKQSDALVVSTYEITALAEEQGCKAHGMHLGGKHAFDFGYVRVTPAFHGSGVPGGHAAGFIVHFHGTTLYFAGDTALFGDMALLGRLEKLDYALLPIGDNFTMGPSDAVEAAKMLQARHVIPMHYSTWPLIEQSPEAFKTQTEAACSSSVLVVEPGSTISLD